jgi:acetyl esterase/lipase
MSSKFDPYSHFGLSLNPDGSLHRAYQTPKTEPNPEPLPGISTVSKDITINNEKKLWARIFRPTKLPSNDNTVARLPILIYFHSGGWVIFSPADNDIHKKCSNFASDIPSIVISVAYRRAPESRLPGQYQDARETILWVKKQVTDSNGEKWLRDYGDPSRCYLYGCGCGGNIVFNTAMQIEDMDLEPLKIGGLVMNQPMFSGEKRTASELRSINFIICIVKIENRNVSFSFRLKYHFCFCKFAIFLF